MRRRDDDLSPFRDDPVFQALTGPATPDELAGEAQALAAFRTANAGRPRRRFAARLGTSGTVAIAAVALSAGAAAAYTASWPAPVQRVFAATIGAPAPKAPHKASAAAKPSSSAPVSAPIAAPGPSRVPSPHASSGAPSAKPTASASPTATPPPVLVVTPPPTTSPTPTTSGQPRLPDATLAITPNSTRVDFGASVTITGALTDADGTPVAGRAIGLAEHLTGEPGWSRVGEVLTTTASGEVIFTVPSLDHNAHFVLRGGAHVHSPITKVAVMPTVDAPVVAPLVGSRQATVTVSVTGGEEGDVVVLRRLGRNPSERTAELDSTGQAVFMTPVPLRHPVHYRIVIRRTEAHTAAASQIFTVSPVGQATS